MHNINHYKRIVRYLLILTANLQSERYLISQNILNRAMSYTILRCQSLYNSTKFIGYHELATVSGGLLAIIQSSNTDTEEFSTEYAVNFWNMASWLSGYLYNNRDAFEGYSSIQDWINTMDLDLEENKNPESIEWRLANTGYIVQGILQFQDIQQIKDETISHSFKLSELYDETEIDLSIIAKQLKSITEEFLEQ